MSKFVFNLLLELNTPAFELPKGEREKSKPYESVACDNTSEN